MLKKLTAHAEIIKQLHLCDLFKQQPDRVGQCAIECGSLFIDYSKNHFNQETLSLLLDYADTLDIPHTIGALFRGDRINITENRPALHTALRSTPTDSLEIDQTNVIDAVHHELAKIKQFAESVHSGAICGYTGKKFDTFINIGIGGSDLGPRLVVDAMADYRLGHTRSFFISNIDYQQIATLKKTINPETSLFIISSKSFSTAETITNANTIKTWLEQIGCKDSSKHFFAVTANENAAMDYGIQADHIFKIWDWVGGRFSLWSAMGLPIVLAIGYEQFESLLAGGRELDAHFKATPMARNAPVILALLDFWYANFFAAKTHAFIPYDEALKFLPDYLAQLFMESNGKSVNFAGQQLDYQTMPITWGAVGTNAQHAFFQLLHQGTHFVPIDFLAPLAKCGDQTHHKMLLANCLGQSQALMQGAEHSDRHHHFAGNKPSTMMLYSELTPKTLGTLLALFEHRAFVQGLLWQINSFDQWGVELGKKLADGLYQNLLGKETGKDIDPSTKALLERYKNNQTN